MFSVWPLKKIILNSHQMAKKWQKSENRKISVFLTTIWAAVCGKIMSNFWKFFEKFRKNLVGHNRKFFFSSCVCTPQSTHTRGQFLVFFFSRDWLWVLGGFIYANKAKKFDLGFSGDLKPIPTKRGVPLINKFPPYRGGIYL